MVTLDVIAKKCGISKAAVSQILNNPNHPRFSKLTKAKVLQTAKELNYLPNSLGRQLRKGRTHLISLIVPWSEPELAENTERVASKYGYSIISQMVLYEQDPKRERKAIMSALERRVDGILWMPAPKQTPIELIAEIAERINTKIILLKTDSNIQRIPNADIIYADPRAAIEEVVKHIIQQGYKKIAYIDHEQYSKIPAEMWDELKGRYQIEIKHIKSPNPLSIEDKLRSNSIEFEEGTVFIAKKWHVLEILQYCRKNNIAIPERIGLVSLWDIKLANRFFVGELTSPSLSTLRNPLEKFAQAAVEQLIKRIEEDDRDTKEENKQTIINVPLMFIPRESTQRIKNAETK